MTRGVRRIKAGKFAAPRAAEMRYVRDLQSIMRQVHKEYMRRLDLRANAQGSLREDAFTEHSGVLDELGTVAITAMRKGVLTAFDRMAKSIKDHTAGVLVGVKRNDLGLAGAIDSARDQNIALMEKAQRSYAGQVRAILEDPAWHNKPVKALTEEIQARADVSESRAALIARDQTLKLNSQITKARATNAGLTSYVWNTSHDERVRPEHVELDGKTFDYATGAPSLDGLNPGEDFQCRCVGIPIFTAE